MVGGLLARLNSDGDLPTSRVWSEIMDGSGNWVRSDLAIGDVLMGIPASPSTLAKLGVPASGANGGIGSATPAGIGAAPGTGAAPVPNVSEKA